MHSQYDKIGVHIPEILLPVKGTDLEKWSVIACDQYTSQPDYWNKVNEEVGAYPSTLKMIFPEIYLDDEGHDERILNINKTMARYIEEGVLEKQKPGFILVERNTPRAASRKGLILALDLECYDYRDGSKSLIRATEGTVLDRIPPRVKIRENASIELPHIMVLIDDPDRTVIEPLFRKTGSFESLYDFKLMQNGGHIKGWKVDDDESLSTVAAALEKLADKDLFAEKYDLSGKADRKVLDNVLLFAVGDGNHSLATAKAHWENVKSQIMPGSDSDESGKTSIPDHPARYALVEIVNIHDEGLVFEPIHRVLFGVNSSVILDKIKEFAGVEWLLFDNEAALMEEFEKCKSPRSCHLLPFILEGTYGLILLHDPVSSLEVDSLQSILDHLLKNEDIKIDYIHGEEVVTAIGSQKNCMGFYLPALNKHDFFCKIILNGVLPRKTFSMGEAEEKRYYLECRIIR